MTEAVVSSSINNGDDLLTLKKVIYKKSDKNNGDKQKHSDSKQTNGNELKENDNITDGICFDTDKTSSVELNSQVASDTDGIIDSICTHEESESENIDVSNDSSDEADAKYDDEDNQAVSIDCSGSSYSSNDLEDLESTNIKSLSTSYSNIFARLPLNPDKELDDDYLQFEVKKRKFEEVSPEHEHFLRPKKMKMVWDFIKHPFKKTTENTSTEENTTEQKSCSIM